MIGINSGLWGEHHSDLTEAAVLNWEPLNGALESKEKLNLVAKKEKLEQGKKTQVSFSDLVPMKGRRGAGGRGENR